MAVFVVLATVPIPGGDRSKISYTLSKLRYIVVYMLLCIITPPERGLSPKWLIFTVYTGALVHVFPISPELILKMIVVLQTTNSEF